MKKYDAIFFDLDGTLTDPSEGITNGIQFAADYFGVKTNKEDLIKYIGPPLKDTFTELISSDAVETAVKKYRERYINGGGYKYETSLYDNVIETLRELRNRGYLICTASSKPRVYVEEILKHFNIRDYFDFVGGASLDEKVSKKEDVINVVLSEMNISNNRVLMVGDRKYDLIGAEIMGMDSVGVLYGFGNYDELSQCNSIALIDNISELLNILE